MPQKTPEGYEELVDLIKRSQLPHEEEIRRWLESEGAERNVEDVQGAPGEASIRVLHPAGLVPDHDR
jgi:hypothetical protein